MFYVFNINYINMCNQQSIYSSEDITQKTQDEMFLKALEWMRSDMKSPDEKEKPILTITNNVLDEVEKNMY